EVRGSAVGRRAQGGRAGAYCAGCMGQEVLAGGGGRARDSAWARGLGPGRGREQG
ncbi:hypothetical protein KI387_020244, partial [Taxus chinensis]